MRSPLAGSFQIKLSALHPGPRNVHVQPPLVPLIKIFELAFSGLWKGIAYNKLRREKARIIIISYIQHRFKRTRIKSAFWGFFWVPKKSKQIQSEFVFTLPFNRLCPIVHLQNDVIASVISRKLMLLNQSFLNIQIYFQVS